MRAASNWAGPGGWMGPPSIIISADPQNAGGGGCGESHQAVCRLSRCLGQDYETTAMYTPAYTHEYVHACARAPQQASKQVATFRYMVRVVTQAIAISRHSSVVVSVFFVFGVVFVRRALTHIGASGGSSSSGSSSSSSSSSSSRARKNSQFAVSGAGCGRREGGYLWLPWLCMQQRLPLLTVLAGPHEKHRHDAPDVWLRLVSFLSAMTVLTKAVASRRAVVPWKRTS
ncbi:hypothetical protein BKA81DRAFT_76914 [Phyllosticta paracitricarpa]